MKFTTQFSRNVVSKKFKKPSKTEQCYKDECNIDFIISNFVRTGQDPTQGKQMSYVDCTQVKDFQAAQELVAATKSMFYSLPSQVRDEFKTVDNYLEYVSNPKNLKDCYERNLIDRSTVDEFDVYPEHKEQFVKDMQNTLNNRQPKDVAENQAPSEPQSASTNS